MIKNNYLSIKKALKLFKTSDKTIRRYIVSNDIEARKEGGKLKVNISDLEKLFEKKEGKIKEKENKQNNESGKEREGESKSFLERESFYQNQINEKDKQLDLRAEEIKRKDEQIDKILERQGENNILMGNLEKKVNDLESKLQEKNKLLEEKTKEERLIVPYNSSENESVDVEVKKTVLKEESTEKLKKEGEIKRKFYKNPNFLIPIFLIVLILVGYLVVNMYL